MEAAKVQELDLSTPEVQEVDSSTPDEAAPAVRSILGPDLFVGFDLGDLAASIADFAAGLIDIRSKAFERLPQLGTELFNILIGRSKIEPDPSDKRFTDPAWKENPFYRALMQGYLAWRGAMFDLVNEQTTNGSDWKTPAQQRFAVSLLTEALAPTNNLLGNPAALKRAFDTGGLSLLKGLRNFVDDQLHNGGMPSQVDKRPFKVGENIGASAGAVVYRHELCELIQYTPATRQVYERPLLLVPPQINKYYIMDLAPKRSLTEYAVGRGIQFFTISWRNPGPEFRDRGLADYIAAIKELIGVISKITGSPDINLLGVCAGGITSSVLLGHLAAVGERLVNAATLVVTMLDSSEPSMTGMFATEEMARAACLRSRQRGVLDAGSMARLFAWLRPNDLVWHYWVNNYLMGKEPAPFDILFWNGDSTNLPAQLHADFLDILLRNALVHANQLKVLGTPINLRDVNSDMYILAGQTDHICAWQACHRAARLFGGEVEFVLNSSGHVQSLVCPPDNFKARYFTNAQPANDAETWYQSAIQHKGSWWEHWTEWLSRRSGEKRPAPKEPGNAQYPALQAAPGSYVFQCA
ncbi:MAG: alpha/beta fold hydrolase [Deltaproteobacteria bacterium]|nr:alpha/beta fold hydrolase [Deltaproteobacteria bacterium]